MSVVVDEAQGETSAADAIETPAATVLFMARRESLRLTRKARTPIINPHTGQRSGMSQGESLGFRDGILRIPKEGKVRAIDTADAGEWEIDAAELLAWLRGHRLFHDVHEGFWEVDQVAPPPSDAELDAMMAAATRFDEDGLRAMRDRELEGWNRPSLVKILDGALERIDAMKAQAFKDAEAKLAVDGEQPLVADGPLEGSDETGE